MNPWHDIEPRKQSADTLDCVIEIPRGGRLKYELDKETGLLRLDRVLYSAVFYPANYGFIPRTYCDDSDPLDILVLGNHDVVPLCIMTARPIGVMEMVDQDEVDDKIIAIHEHDPAFNHLSDISQLPRHTLNELQRFFEDYKILENKKVRIERFKGRVDAHAIIEQAFLLYDATFEHGGAPKITAPDPAAKEAANAARNPSKQVRLEAAKRAATHNANRNSEGETHTDGDTENHAE